MIKQNMNKDNRSLYINFVLDLAKEVENYLNEKFPIIRTFGSSDAVIEGIKKQSEIAADLGEQYIGNEDPSIPSDKIMQYLNESGTYKHINKKHKNYKRVENLLIKELQIKVKTLSEVFKGHGDSYTELIHSAFIDKETAKNLLMQEYLIRKEELELILEDNTLLNIPFFVRGKASEIIEASFLKEKEIFEEKIFKHWKNA